MFKNLSIPFSILSIITPIMAHAQVTDGPSEDFSAACAASEDTFGQIVQNAIGNTNTELISLMMVLSALVGIIGVGFGIKSLIDATSDSRNTPVANGLLKIFLGSLMIAFPAIITILGQTMFSNAGEARNLNETSFGVGSRQNLCEADTLLGMYENFVRDAADPLTKLAYYAAVIMGVYLISTAIQRLMNASNPTSPHNGKSGQQVIRLFVGALFINIQQLINMLSMTLFNERGGTSYEGNFITNSILSQSSSGTANDALSQFCNINNYIYLGLIPFGIFAVISGLRSIYLNIEGSQQSSIGGGTVKIIAGIILVNMELFANAVVNTINPSAELIARTCGA